MREVLPGIVWPMMFRNSPDSIDIPLSTLEKTQFLSAQEREVQQCRQLRSLVAFAAQHSPYLRENFAVAGLKAANIDSITQLRLLKILTRRDVQQHAQALDCRAHISKHGPFMLTKTSGSTGEPVALYRSAVQHALWMAHTIREHQWHGREASGTLAIIRAGMSGTVLVNRPNWGPPVSLLYKTGPASAMPIDTDIAQQVEWLNDLQPDYLLVYPNNLAALLDVAQAGDLHLSRLKQIRTIGETLSPELRERVRATLGVPVVDIYSSQELGVIACQCPVSGEYHVMENLLVEVLDANGKLCQPGEIGRVVITDLYSFANPLLRYDIGDYAQVAEAQSCACGRGLHTLRLIRGRERNMLRLPDGQQRWPLVGFHHFREIADIAQYQIIQRDYAQLEVRLVCHPALTAMQEAQLREVITTALRHDFKIQFTYYTDAIPRGENGKFEEFVCAIGAHT